MRATAYGAWANRRLAAPCRKIEGMEIVAVKRVEEAVGKMR
jgi:hypothetical protein